MHVDFPIELSEAQKRIVKGWSNDMFSSYDDDDDDDDNDNDRGYDNTMENEMVDEEDTDVDDINLEIDT